MMGDESYPLPGEDDFPLSETKYYTFKRPWYITVTSIEHNNYNAQNQYLQNGDHNHLLSTYISITYESTNNKDAHKLQIFIASVLGLG